LECPVELGSGFNPLLFEVVYLAGKVTEKLFVTFSGSMTTAKVKAELRKGTSSITGKGKAMKSKGG
jgi:hypothetical protein